MSEQHDDKHKRDIKDLETQKDPKAGGPFKTGGSSANPPGGTTTDPVPPPGS